MVKYSYDRTTKVSSQALPTEDCSTHPTVVEYAVRQLFKRQSPATAAKYTVKALSGHPNMFLGPGIPLIDPSKLEEALYGRLVENVIKALSKIKEGMGHFALDGVVIDQFKQGMKVRELVKKRVIRELRRDPFPNDDR